MKFIPLLGAFAATMTISTAVHANVEYDCGEYNNALYSITYFDEEDVAEIRAVDLAGQTASALMRPAPSGSGSRYVSETGLTEFVEHQGNAFLFVQGVQLNCTVFAITEPGGPTVFPGNPPIPPQGGGVFAGFSFGGNLRAGPGTNFADVGSTFNGQQLTLISDTGVNLNGYNWWVVQLQNGQQAHQWGGLLCAPQFFLNGIFNDGC